MQVSEPEYIAARGAWGTVEWAIDSRKRMPARDLYLRLPPEDQAKVSTLFKRLADFGRISNREKFNQLGERAGPKGRHIWEFKSFQIRFLGEFRPGSRFVVAHGTDIKKSRELPPKDIEIAIRVLAEHDARRSGSK